MAVSVGTLSVAIGAGAATWSMLSAVILNPLAVRNADRLAVIGAVVDAGARGPIQTGLIYPYYSHVATSGVFESTAAVWLSSLPLRVGSQKAPQATPVMFVSETFFDVLGLTPSLGRVFSSDENRRGVAPVAILSDRYWRAAFRANPDVIGQSVRIGERLATIIGVAPRRFRGLSLAQDPAMFLPLETIADVGPSTTNYFAESQHTSSPTAGLGIIGRVRAGQTFEEARARLALVVPLPGRGGQVPWHVTDIQSAAIPAVAREGTVRFARLLTATVGLLVLIGCSTVGLLLLVRTEARREEFATCLALGATRAQLARGVVIEGAILTSVAACLSPLVASWLFSIVSTFQLPGGIALGLLDLSLDRRALAIIAALAVGTTLLLTT